MRRARPLRRPSQPRARFCAGLKEFFMRGVVPAVLVASSLAALSVTLVKAAPQAPARAVSSRTALDRYVAAPDSSFTWKAVRELPAEDVTATLIEMTSQRWLTEKEVERP